MACYTKKIHVFVLLFCVVHMTHAGVGDLIWWVFGWQVAVAKYTKEQLNKEVSEFECLYTIEIAIKENNTTILRQLLAEGFKPTLVDVWACEEHKRLDLLKIIIDESDLDPDMVVAHQADGKHDTTLLYGIKTPSAFFMLLDKKKQLERSIQDDLNNSLHHAANSVAPDMIAKLLLRGADPCVKQGNYIPRDRVERHYEQTEEHTRAIQLLLNAEQERRMKTSRLNPNDNLL